MMKFIATTHDKMSKIPVVSGQMIFSMDEKVIYLDASTTRTSYKSIIELSTENDRKALMFPVKGFYYIEETNVLWRYDGANWTQLTNSSGENVVFIDKNGMPDNGEIEKIYVNSNDNIIYRWDDKQKQFISLCQAQWENI